MNTTRTVHVHQASRSGIRASCYRMYPARAILVLFTTASGHVMAQNLVPNPSFEEVTSCPTFASMLDSAAPWFNPTQGTPELFHACAGSGAYAGVPVNYSGGHQVPRTGDGFAGIYVYRGDNSEMREYIEVPLLEPLEAGACYAFCMYVNAANDNELVCDGVGAYFSTGALEMNTWQVLPITPHIEHPAGSLINDTLGWTAVSGTYLATGGEDHLVIGNFRNDASTTSSMFNPGVWYANMSYLLVDDVSVFRNDLMPIDLGPDTLLCAGSSVTLNAERPGATSVEWNDGGLEPVRTVSEEGPYAVTVHFGACSDSDTIVIDNAPEPWIDLGPDRELCAGLMVSVMAGSNGSILWDDGSTSEVRLLVAPGTYYATTINACGSASDSLIVLLEDCPEAIYLPNGITPDGDAINDAFAPVFDPRLWAVSYTIHDRWGRVVFHSSDGAEWPASDVPIGVYVYRLRAEALTTPPAHREISGHVAVVR